MGSSVWPIPSASPGASAPASSVILMRTADSPRGGSCTLVLSAAYSQRPILGMDSPMEIPNHYFIELATAFVRGRFGDPTATIEDGRRAGLRLNKFKNDSILPRVRRVIGILRGLAPESLLDVGSGRGTFLWALLDAFPDLPVTSIDVSEQRVADLKAVATGGVARLTAIEMDAQEMSFASKSFDVVTLLEVLEHMPNPNAALRSAVAVARRFVVLSVPSVPDDNPEHLHLFSPEQLSAMAAEAGACRVAIEHVLNHRIAILRVQP